MRSRRRRLAERLVAVDPAWFRPVLSPHVGSYAYPSGIAQIGGRVGRSLFGPDNRRPHLAVRDEIAGR